MTPRAYRYDLRLLTWISTQALTGQRLSGITHKHAYIAQKQVQMDFGWTALCFLHILSAIHVIVVSVMSNWYCHQF